MVTTNWLPTAASDTFTAKVPDIATSPPKVAVPDTAVPLESTVPLTKKKTSVPISPGESGAAGED